MKWIKLFESYDKGYEVIQSPEFNNIFNDIIRKSDNDFFNTKEIKGIKEIIEPENKFDLRDSIIYITNNIKIPIPKDRESDVYFGAAADRAERTRKIGIYKLKDEWYLVFKETKNDPTPGRQYEYYKCDQFDDLLNCIKDIIWEYDNNPIEFKYTPL